MIDLSLRVDMLAGPNDHGVCGGHVGERRLSGVSVRDPYRYRESVYRPTEVHGYRSGETKEESRRAVGKCFISQ